MLFYNRQDAAMKLIPYLEKYKGNAGVVLAVPRGGIPVGFYIAKHFKFPMEPLLTKKIGHPWSMELAIGAVSLEDQIIDGRHNLPKAYVEKEIKLLRQMLKERYVKFMAGRKPVDLKNKVVIIVDDGIATGNTLLAAIRMIRKKQPEKIVVAAPVAPTGTAERIEKEVDDLICLHTLDNFVGVGLYYADFSQVSDEEVIRLLEEINRIENTA
ncbi:MAG TPA: phosphoribosyltransferase family protein [Bacteroidia bacterium]|jgi:predicted phosphoribosyltransferase